MSDHSPVESHAAVARVKTGRSFSLVWLVPLVALLIGGWLAVKALSEKGSTITITFASAEGLEAGKTKIKFKDVEIGKVETISLSDDLKQVVVTAEVVKGAERYLTDRSRFWVVRAMIRGGTVSGLGTMLSGAYIGIDPNTGGQPTRTFTGLEFPPVVTSGLPGRHFWLRADRLGSLNVGTPVYYRQIQVGQVVSYGFSADGQAVDIQIFIDAPHHARITENTRFWNASGVDVSLNAQGLKVDTESMVSVIGGGLAFDIPNGTPPGKEAVEHTVFPLYPNRDSIQEKSYTVRTHWMIIFEESVRGLSVGAPVEMYGIRIGEVVSLELQYDRKRKGFRVPVVIAVEPERIGRIDDAIAEFRHNPHKAPVLKSLVEQHSLRAQLKNGNLLTGQRLIDLDFHPRNPKVHLAFEEGYPVIPAVPGSFEQLQESLARITASLEKIPFEQLGTELHEALREATATLKQTGALAGTLNSETAPQIKATLDELQTTLVEFQGTVGKNSPLSHNANKALEDFSQALRALRKLMETLDQQPQSLIFGKGEASHEEE